MTLFDYVFSCFSDVFGYFYNLFHIDVIGGVTSGMIILLVVCIVFIVLFFKKFDD